MSDTRCYMIITAKVHDRDAFLSGYAAATAPLVERFGGRYVMRAPGATVLEGDLADGASVAISEWPDREAALRFWNSPDYAKARPLRDGLADVQVLIVEAPAL
ncbi:MAG: DUF1330 domain-containing protein, partial [Litorimonas sp.]